MFVLSYTTNVVACPLPPQVLAWGGVAGVVLVWGGVAGVVLVVVDGLLVVVDVVDVVEETSADGA